MSVFTEVGIVDHQCFFALYDLLDRKGRIINPERLEFEKGLLEKRLREAAARDIDVYHVFGRSFVHFLNYEAYNIYPHDHPRRTGVATFREAFRECTDLAAELGISVGFAMNQFTYPPEVFSTLGNEIGGDGPTAARVCPGRNLTWELYRAALNEFFEACPGVSVLQLTTNETQVNVVDCHCPRCADLPLAERLAKLANTTHEVAARHRVEVQLRSWGEMEDEGFFDRISDALHKDIAVSVKNTHGDFHLSVPPHPMIGYGDRSQIVEFDAWREFSGWNSYPCFMGEIYRERLKRCSENDVRRVTIRATWLPYCRRLETVPWGNQLNLEAFFALVENLDSDLDALLRRELAAFAGEALDEVVELYQESAAFLRASYYPDGMYLHNHSTIRTPWETGLDAIAATRHWFAAAMQTHQPTAQRLGEIAAENATLWQETVDRVEKLRGRTDDAFYADLHRNAVGQRYLLEILPRLVQLIVWADSPQKEPPSFYQQPIEELRQLAADWQRESPQHFEDMLGAEAFVAVRAFSLWLTQVRPENL